MTDQAHFRGHRFFRRALRDLPYRREAIAIRPDRLGGHPVKRGARVAVGFKVDLVKAPYAARQMPPVRRLTAILAADVAGYSRLMGQDEEGTHERLRGHLRDLVDPKIAEHRGRIVKTIGDGVLAEVASVVDAVRCLVEIQRGMIDGEPHVPDERRIRFRIGVNLGDVIAEEDDIFGPPDLASSGPLAFTAAPVCARQRAPRRMLAGGPNGRTH